MELPPRVAAGVKQWVPEDRWLLRHKCGSGDVPVTSKVTNVTTDTGRVWEGRKEKAETETEEKIDKKKKEKIGQI